ncbi:ubiquitin carboxyl-terminal hydrolase 26-like isoform X2 [Aristolochia californica]|uniref:ubiquitin carboxyl-terminal hydrolase 26-like isoform X2 n=1 Tax=Aristolochia californica TaxID=171875 RepID=UPI0035DC6F62
MSKPTTRSKNKRHRPDGNEVPSSEILRKFYANKEISQDDINQLYLISKPICQSCRANSKDSSNCFCALIPPPNGSRKSGLWQKISEVVQDLGPDPYQDLRSSVDLPSGLTNLGATCYANSILQCLYMNTSFRAGIFSVEPELLKQQPVLDQLAQLFAQLCSSRLAFVDSAPFIKTLELDNGSQQDSHEFFTLFLSLLEQSLGRSKVAEAKTIVQDLFRGSISHVTRCSVCGKESEASSKTEDFYELELNIKGLKNLNDSLDDYLSVEELQGENQYFCESCGTRVDATRAIKLHKLPPVLNFQLKRCVFLPKTTTKKKLTSVFSFPRQLNMAQRLCDSSLTELIYDLSTILIHKGTAVNSGHYVAHIKDEFSGLWWEFDDEHVSKLGLHPFGEGPSGSLMKAACSEPGGPLMNGNHNETSSLPSVDNDFINHTEVFSSADAYMLMYKRRHPKDNGMVEANLDGNRKDFLPSHLSDEVETLNASTIAACEEYKLKKETLVGIITERRQEVRSLLSEIPVHSLGDPFFWISTEWLRQWSDSITLSSIDNKSIQCSHGKVPLSKVGSIKRISEIAWHKLLSKYGGGPELSGGDYCIKCLEDVAKTTVSADNYRVRRLSMKEIAEAALTGNCPDENLYYVSRPWLLQWVRRKHIDSPCDADVGPTSSLQCPHGRLMPDVTPAAKRLLVPESLWLFLVESAYAVKPDDALGCLMFPAGSEPCAVCCTELTEIACLEDSQKAAKMQQRQKHEKLFLGRSIGLHPGCRYYLIPSSWLTRWRAYITISGKGISSVEPDNLEVVIDSLKCQKHFKLVERPPELMCKRGVIIQKTSSADGLTIITERDWKLFCEDWNAPEEKGLYAEIEFPSCTSKLGDSSEDMPISDSHLDRSSDAVDTEHESKLSTIKTFPEVCEVCVGERESCELMRKLNYCNEDIRIFLVPSGKEAPRSVVEAASGTLFEPDRRASKRSRRTSGGNSISLRVSGTTSMYQLKMMIWESFGVVKENQKLHKGSREIEGSESTTLADMNILPGDVLWVTDLEIHENRDIADELSNQKMEPQQFEEGFRGTLLTSNGL